MVMPMIYLNVAGGDCVDDVRVLESDEGFCRFLREVEGYGRTSSEKRALKRRWRKERTRTVPSETTIRDWLACFHDPEQENQKEPHRAFIQRPTEHLMGLITYNAAFAAQVQRRSPETGAALDMDATLSQTYKREAEYCYKKYKAYQPLNFYWAEQQLILFSQFRDGNVPAGVDSVFLRSDAAGYQEDLLKYCAEAKNERFGVIDFAIGASVNEAYRQAVAEVPDGDWHALYRKVKGKLVDTGQEYAEVCFVPTWAGRKKHGPDYRYVAIREALEQQALCGLDGQLGFPFQTMDWGTVKYKVTGIVTNRTCTADELIWWYRGRCGKSEEAHSIMKEDLAGGKFPSGLFGANAAWWQIMILALNLNSAMKRLVLGGSWVNRRMKAIRFWLVKVPGRVLTHARSLIVRLVGGHPSNEILFDARRRMVHLCDSG